jgi:hypothetical protein
MSQLLVTSRSKEIRTLVNFLKALSMDWDFDSVNLQHSISLSKKHLRNYYHACIEQVGEHNLQGVHNFTFIATCSLWCADYAMCPMVHDFLLSCLRKTDTTTISLLLPQIVSSLCVTRDTSTFEKIVSRIIDCPIATTRLFWILMLRFDQPRSQQDTTFYSTATYHLMTLLLENNSRAVLRNHLKKSGLLVEKLVRCAILVRQSRGTTSDKITVLKSFLTDATNDLLLFEPMLLPLSSVLVTSIDVDKCSVFYSQLCPILLTFSSKDGQPVKVIFKVGDDLNQDAIVTDILKLLRSLCNSLLDEDNIIIYNLLPTGKGHGFVEYIESNSLDNILQEQSLKQYFNSDNACLLRFVQSSAFYTVATYVLCVGDRHLDNILLTRDGKLFHIDYGYLGREPKPFATACKLCPEMVEAMGGKHTGWYAQFLTLCRDVFRVFRDNSNVIMDMLKGVSLDRDEMKNGCATDLNAETLDKIRSRLAVSSTLGEAWENLHNEIEKGYEAKIPHMMDNFHRTWKMVNGGKRTTDANDEEWFFLE